MYEVIFLSGIALIWIIFASIQDLRTREVANWLSFSLIIFVLGFRFFYSLFSFSVGNTSGFGFFYNGLIGLGIFFILGNLFYYGRVFAGGDAKLMIALGTVLPLSMNFFTNLKIFLLFFLLFFVTGAFYGMFWSFALGARNFKNFKKEFKKQFRKNNRIIFSVMVLGIIFMVFGFFESLFFSLGILIFVFPYFFLYAKSVEEACMIKNVNAKELTEGDWLYKDLKFSGKKTRLVKATWEGLSMKEISQIKKHYGKNKKIKIKQGIPFVPVFLISFLALIWIYFFQADSGYPFWKPEFFNFGLF